MITGKQAAEMLTKMEELSREIADFKALRPKQVWGIRSGGHSCPKCGEDTVNIVSLICRDKACGYDALWDNVEVSE